jgi:hypothetical protein
MLDFEDIRDLREEWEFTLDRDAYRSKIAAYVADMAVDAAASIRERSRS